MDNDKIIQELNKRFAAPLPEFYKRRIIFWKDEEREFIDTAPAIELANAKVVALDDTNNFAIKKLLTSDDKNSNFLVYCPVSYPDEENWLLPIELYSEDYRADQISTWIDEMGMDKNISLRKAVKSYRKFFKTSGHRTKVARLPKKINTPSQLQLAVMSVLCGLKNAQPGAVIRAIITAGLDMDTNPLYAKLAEYDAQDAFWTMVAQGTGYQEKEPTLDRMTCHILLTATTRTMRAELLAGLEGFISTVHQAYCYDFVSDWLHSDGKDRLAEIARYVEDELRLPWRFDKMSLDDLKETEIFPCINECILKKLMSDISDHIIEVDTISEMVELRRTCAWYESFKNYYEGLLACANMQAFFHDHAAGFHTVEAKRVWKEYTEDYYKMDTYYRQFHCSYSHNLQSYHLILDDLFKQVADKVEGLYSHWFLGELGSNWSDACMDSLAKYGCVPEVSQQRSFYSKRVASADSRVFVIISDALRYEVGASLAEQLRRETQAEVKLSSCEAIFPTVTKFGMAALLPHKELTVEMKGNELAVLADGSSTEAGNRDAVLKKQNAESLAVKYNDLIKMDGKGSAYVKGYKIVYIYHDKIDETGHVNEDLVCTACEGAIEEIKNMVKVIVNYYGGTRILITADHGFLYTAKPLSEDSKVDKTTAKAEDVEVDRRYLITKKGASPEYLLSVKFLDGNTEYDAFAPRESIRIKKKGGGLNYVHGGISLQEMVVPVIDYHYLRNQNKKYQRSRDQYDTKPVTISLLSASRKISNMIFSLNFYQKEAVGDNREAANYLLYFVDSENKQISDTQKIIADKTNENNQERTFRCSFNLKSMKYNEKETYYLVIVDESGIQMPQREEFQIDIAFAVDDFDFFS